VSNGLATAPVMCHKAFHVRIAGRTATPGMRFIQ